MTMSDPTRTLTPMNYCTQRTPSNDPRDHVCRRPNTHRGSHACTCGFTWRHIQEHQLTQLYPDITLEHEPA